MSGLESVAQEAAIAWRNELGWPHVLGPVLAPDVEAIRNVQRTFSECVCRRG